MFKVYPRVPYDQPFWYRLVLPIQDQEFKVFVSSTHYITVVYLTLFIPYLIWYIFIFAPHSSHDTLFASLKILFPSLLYLCCMFLLILFHFACVSSMSLSKLLYYVEIPLFVCFFLFLKYIFFSSLYILVFL